MWPMHAYELQCSLHLELSNRAVLPVNLLHHLCQFLGAAYPQGVGEARQQASGDLPTHPPHDCAWQG